MRGGGCHVGDRFAIKRPDADVGLLGASRNEHKIAGEIEAVDAGVALVLEIV